MSIDEILKQIINETDLGNIHHLAMTALDSLPTTGQPVEYATPEIAEGDLSEVESDLCEYIDGFERLSKYDCKAWASMIMQSVIRPHLCAPKREEVTLSEPEIADAIRSMIDAAQARGYDGKGMSSAFQALVDRYELRRRA